MKILGKCPPEPEELRSTFKNGFENVELYLEEKHLDSLEQTIQTAKDAEVNVESVHTPHVNPTRHRLLQKTDRLASRLDAYMVVHSKFMHHTYISEIEGQLDFSSDYGYENNPGTSCRTVKNMILGQNFELVLDTAHLYIAEGDFTSTFSALLNEHSERIKVVHLCDSSETVDGLPFGEGEIDMREAVEILTDSDFDGKVVLEVMPEHQKDALEKFNDYKI